MSLLKLGRFFQKLVWVFYALMGFKHFAAGERHVGLIKSTWQVLSCKASFSEGKGKPEEALNVRCFSPRCKLLSGTGDLVIRSCHKICLVEVNSALSLQHIYHVLRSVSLVSW